MFKMLKMKNTISLLIVGCSLGAISLLIVGCSLLPLTVTADDDNTLKTPLGALLPANFSVSTACNGHGNKYEISEQEILEFYGMTPTCLCFPCFYGASCEHKEDIHTCHVGADLVELGLVKSVLPSVAMTFSSQHRMAYEGWQSISNNTQISATLMQTIKDLHLAAGNVDFSDHELLIGVGSHQLIQAAMYGLTTNRTNTTAIYAAPPYWSKFKRMVNAYSPVNEFVDDYGVAQDIIDRGDNIIDFITSPSNSGNLLADEQELLGLSPALQIHDLVYYWPSSVSKDKIIPLSENIMIFSLSKLAGHAGQRFGWAWVKDPEVADRMKEYLAVSTQSYPAAGLVYSTRVMQLLLASLGTDDDFFEAVQDILMSRCKDIRRIFKDGGDKFKIKSPCGNMYVLVKCMDLEADDSCKETYFEPIQLSVTNGNAMGVDNSYVRLAIGYDQPHFELILKKLELLHMD